MSYTKIRSKFFSEVGACLALAMPLAGAQIAQSATAFVDTIMMGLLGSQILAAGGLGAATFNALLITTTGIVSAVSPLAAEAYGAGKTTVVERVARQGLWLAIGLAIPVTLALWHAGPVLLRLGQPPEVVRLAETYLQAIAWGILPALGFAVLRSVVAALSQPRWVMLTVIFGTFLNVVGNYVLMFGKLGFPALGLAGIGWASSFSLWSMFGVLALCIVRHSQLKRYRIFQQLFQFDWKIFHELVQTGWPIGGLVAVEVGLFTVTTFLMGQLGTVPLAAHHIALQTAALTFNVPLGVAYATTVRVGQLMGQGEPKNAKLAGYTGIAIAALFMSVMALLFWTLPMRIVSLYLDVDNPANATVVELAIALLGVAAVFQIVDGVQVVAAGALRGLKDTRMPMLIGILAYWCIGLTTGYGLGMKLGFGGVGFWWGLAIGLAVAAIILTWRFSAAPLISDSLPIESDRKRSTPHESV